MVTDRKQCHNLLLNETSRLWNNLNLVTPPIYNIELHLTACIYGQKSVWKDVPQSVHGGSLYAVEVSSGDFLYFLLYTFLKHSLPK